METIPAIFVHIKIARNKWIEFLYREYEEDNLTLVHIIHGLSDEDIDHFINLVEEYKKNKE